MKMNYPVLVGRDHRDVLDTFGPMPGVPMSIVIARDGTICARHAGIAAMDVFEREIEPLL
jgi:hypothetical protein